MRKQSPLWIAASVVVSTVAMAQDKPPIVSLPEANAPDASSASQLETTGQAPKFEDRSREKIDGLFVGASPHRTRGRALEVFAAFQIPLLGLNLLLLLDCGPDFLSCFRSANHLIGCFVAICFVAICFVAICFVVIRQPQPDLRHLQ